MKKGLFFLLFMVAFVFKGISQSTPADSTEMYAYIDSVLAEARGPIKRTDFFNLMTTFNAYIDIKAAGGGSKLNTSDTAAMLASYTRYVEFLDSISDLRSDLGAGALQLTDTASMLLSYIQRSDTAAMLMPYISRNDTAAAFAPFIERSDTASMLDSYRRNLDYVMATDYPGIVNTGTAIDSTVIYNFLTWQNGKKVFFPPGDYNFINGQDIERLVSINWHGVPRASFIKGQSLRILGSITLKGINWKDSPIIWRFDNNTGTPTDTVDFVAHDIYLRDCQMFIRNAVGSNPQLFNRVEIIGFEHDTINSSVSGGAFIQWDQVFKSIYIANGLVHHNTDSNYVTLFRISNSDGAYRTADTSVVLRNIEITDIITSETNAPAPVTSKLLISINGEGARVLTDNIKVSDVNLPQFDLRGSGSQTILRNWRVEIDKVVGTSTNTDYMLINKSRGYRYDWATIIENCNFELKFGSGQGGGGVISTAYFENNGNRIIRNCQILTEGFAGMTGIRVLSGETPGYYNRFVVQDSEIRSYGPVGIQAFWIADDIHYVEMSNTTIEGSESIYGQAITSEVAEEFRFFNCNFLGGFQTVTQRDVKRLTFESCVFNGVDFYNFSSNIRTTINNCTFIDDTITAPNTTTDLHFEFGAARCTYWTNCTFDLTRLQRVGPSSDHETYATGLDTLIFNYNKGRINGNLNSVMWINRINSLDYYEAVGNKISYGGAANSSRPSLIYVETSITEAYIANNKLLMDDGSNIDKLITGAGTITSLRAFNNTGFDDFNTGNTITYANMNASGLEDMSGNAYLTTKSSGWAHYIDTAYATAADSFYVAQGSTLTLPIKADMTAALATNYLPNGVDSLFSQHDSIILGITTGASYTVRVTFKAKNSNNTGYATIALDIGTGGTPNITSSETFVFPKGAGVETQESKTILLYSLDTFVANGCKIKITADTGNLEIYDIRLLVRLDSRP